MGLAARQALGHGVTLAGVFCLAACGGSSGGNGGSGGSGGNGGNSGDDCGNNILDTGEQCDGTNLSGMTCVDRGYDPGTLACANCSFDTSGCGPKIVCGDDTAGVTEFCDGGDAKGGDCISAGFNGGAALCNDTCDGFDTSGCSGGAACGDGIVMPPEVCDGATLGAWGCTTVGFFSGTLTCATDCLGFDTSQCNNGTPSCGDGLAQGLERCDGTDVRGRTCQVLGFVDGTLACDMLNAPCNAYDTSGCNGTGPSCNNAIIEGIEECDGAELGGATCKTEGFTGGTLGCATDCSFDYSRCTAGPVCGDGDLTGDEQCDGTNFAGNTCMTLGWEAGVLRCNSGCNLDQSACIGCGDGNLSVTEQCETGNLRDETCESRGFTGGALACTDACHFDDTACTGTPTCGDGIIAGAEQCEGSDLGSGGCTTTGYLGGSVTCNGSCMYELSGCTGKENGCGDGVAALHICDGADALTDCAGLGLTGGAFVCNADCTPDLSGCTGGTDGCQGLGWYANGWCDPCGDLGGNADSECATLCLAEGTCAEWFFGGISTCAAAGLGTDPDCGPCGNGALDVGELCDGTAFADRAQDGTPDDQCADWGAYTGGKLTCGINCAPEFSGCTTN